MAVDKDDLGGVVTSAKGPEAGVWVIAETSELPTKLAKIVVTDDRGRYLIPDMPLVKYNVWVRGYGLVDSPKVQASPGTLLSGRVLVLAGEGPGAIGIPGNGTVGQRHLAEYQDAGRLGEDAEVGHLHGVSSTRERSDAHDSGRARVVLIERPGVGAAAAVGAGGPQHDSRAQLAGP